MAEYIQSKLRKFETFYTREFFTRTRKKTMRKRERETDKKRKQE